MRGDSFAKLLIVDLLAEREGFGRKGVEEIVKHFPNHEVLLWAPHTDEARDYGFGIRIQEPTDADVVVITGSRKNVSMWEDWMDDVDFLYSIQGQKMKVFEMASGENYNQKWSFEVTVKYT